MNRLKAALHKLEGRSASELTRESLARMRRRARHALARAADKRAATYITDAELGRALGRRSIADVAASIRNRRSPRLTPGLEDIERAARLVTQLFPDSREKSRRYADDIIAHRITLFGRTHELGPEIDWNRDPVSGESFPLDHFSRVSVRPGRAADARSVWELNRLHHLTALARAYALTRDERCTDEFLLQLGSWWEQNPPRFGINWTVAMEAGIRAVNIIAALDVFRRSPRITDQAVALILKLLIAHGDFIRSNLERSHLGSSNHYLGNLIGLLAIGVAVPELSHSSRWARFAARELTREITLQVSEDGVDVEGSTSYHRLALEIFSLGFILMRAGGFAISPAYLGRIEAMFDFVRCYLKPDGTAPIIGDSDDGRLIKFVQREPVDHSYLMWVAAGLLLHQRFKLGDEPDEELLWWLGEEGLRAVDDLPRGGAPIESAPFRDSQIFIQRSAELYALIDCGDHGLGGRGSHAHSDALSLEVFAYGRTWLRDPGTYVYSASELRRNLFRSTAYHNTVRVDRQEISPVIRGQLFAMGRNVRPKVKDWSSSAERDVLDAEHRAYRRLTKPVTHRRVITFDKVDGFWELRDMFSGEGEHDFEFCFNFDAGLCVRLLEGHALASSEQAALAIVPTSGLNVKSRVVNRWVSPAYGTRLRSSGIIYSLRASVPFESKMLLVPHRSGGESKLERICERYRQRPGAPN